MTGAALFENPILEEKKEINFATIDHVFDDGVTLLFDGEDSPSQKHYLVNSFAVFHEGDRVRLIRDSGTYVVEYSVGKPKTSFNADTADSAVKAETAETAETAKKATNATNATNATTATNATNATKAVNATKASDSDRLGGKTAASLSVAEAADVTKTINGKTISTIFETNGTTVKSATNASKLGGKAAADLSVDAAKKLTGYHSSNMLGFFGKTGSTRKTVATVGSDNISFVRQQLNALIIALQAYNLIG